LGSEIVRATRIWGGYSPSPTFRLKLADGQGAFFKGDNAASPFAQAAFKTEERVYAELADIITPWAPRLLGVVHEAGWRVLLLEDVGPKTAPPWTPALTRRVMRAYAEFHRATLGADLPSWLPRFAHAADEVNWRRLTEQTDGLSQVAALAGAQADDALVWLRQAEPLLARLTVSATDVTGPAAFLHGDTRSDNLRMQGERLRLFDWPWVGIGAVEFDVIPFVQSITVEGGPQPEQVIAWYDETIALRPEVVDIALAWYVGFFANLAWLPEVPGLPRLRRFQRQQLAVLLDWSARRFGLPTPGWTAALAG
jgi:hypothetical protein